MKNQVLPRGRNALVSPGHPFCPPGVSRLYCHKVLAAPATAAAPSSPAGMAQTWRRAVVRRPRGSNGGGRFDHPCRNVFLGGIIFSLMLLGTFIMPDFLWNLILWTVEDLDMIHLQSNNDPMDYDQP